MSAPADAPGRLTSPLRDDGVLATGGKDFALDPPAIERSHDLFCLGWRLGLDAKLEAFVFIDQRDHDAVLGDGGIYTSIDDLVHWIAWLESGRFNQALVPATPTDDPAVQYGFGWRISGPIVSHTGETVGFRNAIVRFPEKHLTVVVLTNRNEGTPYRIALEIASHVILRRAGGEGSRR